MREKSDRRVRYTKRVLKESLLRLMGDKPLEKITVKEICDLADVNRGTFYAHFSDPYDLLAQIEGELMEEISASIGSSLKAEAISGLMEEILASIAGNAALCKVLFSDYGDPAFIKRVMSIAKDQAKAEWRRVLPTAREDQLELMYLFYANGCVAVIQHWLQDGMRESPAELALFIEKVSTLGLRAFRS